ncbi:hypothetical protein D3C75_474180 [compost metagenome]
MDNICHEQQRNTQPVMLQMCLLHRHHSIRTRYAQHRTGITDSLTADTKLIHRTRNLRFVTRLIIERGCQLQQLGYFFVKGHLLHVFVV